MKVSAKKSKKKFLRWFITKILTLLILITGYTARVRQINKEVLKDAIKAKKLYESAAQQGNFDSPNNLGTMYLQGIDITRNYVKAYMWFHLGEMKGDRGAKKNRAFVEKKMSAEEIIEANKMAGEWMQRYVGF